MLKSPRGTGGDLEAWAGCGTHTPKVGVFYALCRILPRGASRECECQSRHGPSAQVTGGEVAPVVRGSCSQHKPSPTLHPSFE